MQVLVKGKKIELPEGSSVFNLVEKLHLTSAEQAVAVSVNGKLCDFDQPLFEKDRVDIWDFEDKQGKEVFWHSSAHILAQAVLRLWPNAKPTIGPAIENGFYYDFADLEISEHDFENIEQQMQKIIEENYKPQREEFFNKNEALQAFSENPYKKELIESFEDSLISGYRQGEFFDLCRGPHLPKLGKVKAVKLLKTSGAYWKGDSQKEMLTRIYGISFPHKKLLQEFLHQLEEAKKRDHRGIGQAMSLFSFKEEAPGMPFIYPRGMVLWDSLLGFLKECLQEAEYEEIKTPILLSKELWIQSGHWEHYRENMYLSEIEKKEFAIKPMNCPGCMLYYGSKKHSYRELPLRVAEIGHVHRFEASGALNGLFRVRAFHQDDAHVFMKPEDISQEIVEILRLADKIYMTFGLSYRLELSTRPEKSIGSEADWEITTRGLKEALDTWGHSYTINEGDGAFYGPKIDIHIKDALGRHWQCGTIQLDMSLPQRFKLEYVASDGTSQMPIMLHRALFGSIERFLGILIEHFAGKFPLWMSPYPIAILPVADRHVPYAKKIQKILRQEGFLCDIDDSQESISKKVRRRQLLHTNYMLTVGDLEEEKEEISVRTRDNLVQKEVLLSDFLEKIKKEKKEKSLMSPYALMEKGDPVYEKSDSRM